MGYKRSYFKLHIYHDGKWDTPWSYEVNPTVDYINKKYGADVVDWGIYGSSYEVQIDIDFWDNRNQIMNQFQSFGFVTTMFGLVYK